MLLASTSYLGLLEGSLLEPTTFLRDSSRGIDLASLVENGRWLQLGEETGWKWKVDNHKSNVMGTVKLCFDLKMARTNC